MLNKQHLIDSIHNSSELFLYKATVDLNSAKYLLSGYENENLDIEWYLNKYEVNK